MSVEIIADNEEDVRFVLGGCRIARAQGQHEKWQDKAVGGYSFHGISIG